MLLWVRGLCKDAVQQTMRPYPEHDVSELVCELAALGLCESLGRNETNRDYACECYHGVGDAHVRPGLRRHGWAALEEQKIAQC